MNQNFGIQFIENLRTQSGGKILHNTNSINYKKNALTKLRISINSYQYYNDFLENIENLNTIHCLNWVSLMSNDLSINTCHAYLQMICQLGSAFTNVPIEKVLPEAANKLNLSANSNNTKNHKLSMISSLAKYLEDIKGIKIKIRGHFPSTKNSKKLRLLPAVNNDIKSNEEFDLMYEIGCLTGTRFEDLYMLQKKDLFVFDQIIINVRNGKGAKKRTAQSLPSSESKVTEIESRLSQKLSQRTDNYIFDISTEDYENAYAKYTEYVCKKYSSKGAHDSRRYCANDWIIQGREPVETSNNVGHSSLEVLPNNYILIYSSKQKKQLSEWAMQNPLPQPDNISRISLSKMHNVTPEGYKKLSSRFLTGVENRNNDLESVLIVFRKRIRETIIATKEEKGKR